MASKKKAKRRSAAALGARDWTPQPIPVDELTFDPNNPRLAGYPDTAKEADILATLWREMSVDEIALSIASNGYFPYEPVFAEKSGNKLVVIEGNRRLAAVKALRSPDVLKRVGAMSLPTISAERRKSLDALPTIICSRKEMWQYLGFKHVNGPQNWESYAKAQYIAWVHNDLNEPLETIAETIGDRHTTVLRLYNGVQTLTQAEKAGVFNREDRHKQHFSFSHLYTGLGYKGIQKFLGVDESDLEKTAPVPKNKIKELGELCVWMFGSKSRNTPPLVQSQNPDLRQLDEALQERRGLDALRSGLPLKVALDISRGDARRFREALTEAKEKLQVARGVLLTGFSGEKDLEVIAQDAVKLAMSIRDEMLEGSVKKTRK